MKKVSLSISILLFASLACNAALPHTQPTTVPTIQAISTLEGQAGLPLTEADVPRLTPNDAKLALEKGEAVIVDVRSAEFYAEGHVAGAISIPLVEFESNIENVPLKKDQWIITYCT
jgi:predicted sulfurtransferase